MIIEKNRTEIENALEFYTAEMYKHEAGTEEHRIARMACLALSFMLASLKKNESTHFYSFG